MTHLHLQLALDSGTIESAALLAALAAPYVDTVEVGTPLLIREGITVLSTMAGVLQGTGVRLFADTKISDEGVKIARLCYEAGADALSVVDGASANTLRAVRAVADAFGKQVWVDLMYHTNPILRARTLAPYADGFIVHRPETGFPPLLINGLLIIDRPIRIAGGLTLDIARRELESRLHESMIVHDGIVIGRAITEAPDVEGALQEFVTLCHNPNATRS